MLGLLDDRRREPDSDSYTIEQGVVYTRKVHDPVGPSTAPSFWPLACIPKPVCFGSVRGVLEGSMLAAPADWDRFYKPCGALPRTFRHADPSKIADRGAQSLASPYPKTMS